MSEKLELKEYEMLRQEVMQYLKEYQNVRNMMYLITVTLLGFCLTNENTMEYVYLLPLIVIIPSYFIYIDYHNNIVRIVAYLIVFCERKDGFPIKWESRLKEYMKENKDTDYRQIPYISSTFVSLFLYLINMRKNILNIAILIVVIIFCVFVFLKKRKVTRKQAVDRWEKMKDNQ